jgi:glycosyltransferase involved in cell wall biosynthesis
MRYNDLMKTIIAVVTCYHDPDYVRARTLRTVVSAVPGVKTIIIKNKKKNALRYVEVLWQMLRVKYREKPAAFLVTFRGQEILPFALLIAGRTPLWFDEFIVPSAYARLENHRQSFKKRMIRVVFRLSEPIYRLCLRRCQAIFSDTPSHAELGAKMSEVNLSRYTPIPVGTDETIFKPKDSTKKVSPFQVFYYTTRMQPLHGIPYVLDAAERLAGDRRISFLLVGGKKPMEQAVNEAIKRGARIEYRPWVPFDDLPKIIRESGVCLGGPFGGTVQAEHVVTGKTYQSLACAVPTIVGENDDTASIFTHQGNAIIVRQQSPEALVDALVWAVEHPSELQRIGEKGRQLYERSFSNEALVRIMTPLVERIRK